MRRWQQLAVRANPVARRTGPVLEVQFQSGPGVQEELELLAAAEQQCNNWNDRSPALERCALRGVVGVPLR